MRQIKFTLATLLVWSFGICLTLQAQNPYQKFIQVEENIVKEEGNTAHKWDCFIYPVPASDALNIKVTKGTVNIDKVVILNEDGETVLTLDHQQSKKLKVNLENLVAGKYIVQIISNAYQMPKMKRFYIVH